MQQEVSPQSEKHTLGPIISMGQLMKYLGKYTHQSVSFREQAKHGKMKIFARKRVTIKKKEQIAEIQVFSGEMDQSTPLGAVKGLAKEIDARFDYMEKHNTLKSPNEKK